MRLLILKTTKSSYVIQLKFFSKSPCKIEASGDFPGAPVVKTLPSDAGGVGSIPGLGRSPGGWRPIPVFLSGESHGQRRLVGYSP